MVVSGDIAYWKLQKILEELKMGSTHAAQQGIVRLRSRDSPSDGGQADVSADTSADRGIHDSG